nr:hypothetical protein HUO10_003612 [Paraburkholderia busanensis]
MNVQSRAPIAATVYRGDIVENTHVAHIAVVDEAGRLLYSFGDPSRVTLVRSAAKPAQALALIETGALARFGFDEADLALMCGSHSSEPRHIERTQRMLAKVGANEGDLRCGGHAPLSDAVQEDWLRRGFTPGAVCSNCSGKHVGMLAGARAIGESFDGYERPEHPLQARVKRTVASVCDLRENDVHWATDGCNLPTPAFALDRLARLFAKLADAQDRVDAADSAGERASDTASGTAGGNAASNAATNAATIDAHTAALSRIYRAMTTHPELVGGEGRFCTTLMQAFDGALVGKVGAEGSYAIGVRACAQTAVLGAQGALGIAVKIEDGGIGVLYAVVAELLERLAIGTATQRAALARFRAPKVLSSTGVETGRLACHFELDGTAATSPPRSSPAA